ncbi:PIG-L deacetylase family protein [Streptomyces zhihengii]|uniref:PIG-L family deacetylase n=1 Tax=Streptomyces zhihengii TaxID=1818004 RepID=A0ABS2UJF2_9ACTN|nr:PIG-L family deacetylase [Streptomyces zhihengii]MBM9617672.1 PIG-L family deacetylase [Streptomyces zhihengii]
MTPAATANAPRTVVLSPHFDDAALSLAGLIAGLPGPVDIVTVYGGAPAAGASVSWWDSNCGFSSPEEAHRARLAEDAAACALLGARQVVLDHPDGPYAAPGAEPDLLDGYLAGLEPGTEILVPLGSNQPDHEAVRRRALNVLTDLGAPPPTVYADLPYTGHLPEWGLPEASEALARSARCGLAYQDLLRGYRTTVRDALTLDDRQWAAKRAAVLCYGSQLAPVSADHGPFLARRGPLACELTWTIAPLL